MKLRNRLLVVFAILSGSIVAFLVLVLSNLQASRQQMATMVDRRLVPLHHLERLTQGNWQLRGNLYKYMILPEERAKVKTEIDGLFAASPKNVDSLRALLSSATDSGLLAAIDANIALYRLAADTLMNAADNGDLETGRRLMGHGGGASNARKAMTGATDSLSQSILDQAELAHEKVEAAAHRAQLASIAFCLLLVAGSFGAAWYLARNVVVPLRAAGNLLDELRKGHLGERLHSARTDEIGDLARGLDAYAASLQGVGSTMTAIGAGDLTGTIVVHDDRDELSLALQNISTSLRRQIEAIRSVCAEVETGSHALDGISSSLSNNADQTAALIEQVAGTSQATSGHLGSVSTAAEEMSASISEISRSSTQAASVAKQGVSEIEATMARLRDLDEASQQIGKVVDLITSIAEQTNLLALNATIEAARAGESGRGFSVVAGEVKELAKQSGSATDVIRQNIARVQTEIVQAVERITRSAELVREISGLQNGIAAAIEEQTATTGEIVRAVGEAAQDSRMVSQSTQHVTASARETRDGASAIAGASGNLKTHAHRLKELVAGFRLES